MFTGIITDVAAVVGQSKTDDGVELVFELPQSWSDLTLGESVSVNGVCLTVSHIDTDTFTCTLIPQTLSVTTFGALIPEHVNLERALVVGARLSGHIVQGHVDGRARVERVNTDSEYRITLSVDDAFRQYLVPKGSVTLNGVSLTIAVLDGNRFEVALVPHTRKATTLPELKAGDDVNVEFDSQVKQSIHTKE